jgi:hypothetical protein
MMTSGTTCSKSRQRTAEFEVSLVWLTGSGTGEPQEFLDNAIQLILKELHAERQGRDPVSDLLGYRQRSTHSVAEKDSWRCNGTG